MAGERTFMDQALTIINNTPNHPLAELVNPETKTWWGRSPYAAEAEHHPSVQAGHRLSSFAGGDRLALQDGHSNQLEGRFVERPGNPVQREAIEIGGVPVDPVDARFWEKEGVIPSGTVANAPTVLGWQPGDTLVAPPPDAFTGTHQESLPGGAGTAIITGDGASAVLMKGMSDFALLLGGGVSVIGTFALMDALRSLQDGQGNRVDPPTDDGSAKGPAAKEPPPKEPPVKEPPKEPPVKQPPPKEQPPKEQPPKEQPPKEQPPKEPPAKEPPPAAAPPPPAPPPSGGDSGGGIPGVSGGGPAAPEGSSPVPSGATSSMSTEQTSLLAFSFSSFDLPDTADVAAEVGPGEGPDLPEIDSGFAVPGPGDPFAIPAPDGDYAVLDLGNDPDLPLSDGAFAIPGPDGDYAVLDLGNDPDLPLSDGAFAIPAPDGGFDLPAPDGDFDLPAPDAGSHELVPTASGGHDDDLAAPPGFDGGLR